MGRRKANLVIADPLLSPYYIRFDGRTYDVYKTGKRRKIDSTVVPNIEWWEEKQVLVSSEQKLIDCVDAIATDKMISMHKSEGAPTQDSRGLTLKDFTSGFNELRIEIAEALNMKVVSND